jgi:hypothetical protein
MSEAKFGSNRAGTWVENGIGSNRTKKPTGTKKAKAEKTKVAKPPKKKVIKKGDK